MAEIGFIYILEHDAGNMVKVGETSRDPKLRGDEYIKQYQLKNFTLKKEYKVPLNARRDVEKRAHKNGNYVLKKTFCFNGLCRAVNFRTSAIIL